MQSSSISINRTVTDHYAVYLTGRKVFPRARLEDHEEIIKRQRYETSSSAPACTGTG